MILNCRSFSLNIEPTVCAILTLLTERKILSLDCSLSTFNTLTCSVTIYKISFVTAFLKSPPTLTNVTIPVVPSDPIPVDSVPRPTNDNVFVEIDSQEVPKMDGSWKVFVGKFLEVGFDINEIPNKLIKITNKVEVKNGSKYIRID